MKIEYTANYRRNLELFWRQFYPDYTIPAGYCVHHIKPQCTFKDKNDPRIHHPKNLIALHQDDHVSIHRCRGDKQLSTPFLTSVIGRVASIESCEKMVISQKKRFEENPVTNETKAKMTLAKQNISDATRQRMSKSATGRKAANSTKQKMSIMRIGEGNSRFKGYYITPWGKFTTLDSASLMTVSRTAVQRWCNNADKIISKISVRQSKYLTDDDCGKTFREIGFLFECINTNNITGDRNVVHT